MNDWAVYRQDYTGNEYLVEKGLTEEQAKALAEEYESHKHHQHYWVDRQPSESADFAALLAKMLSDGSSPELSLPVLRTQGATPAECLDALQKASKLPFEQCEAIVDSCFSD